MEIEVEVEVAVEVEVWFWLQWYMACVSISWQANGDRVLFMYSVSACGARVRWHKWCPLQDLPPPSVRTAREHSQMGQADALWVILEEK